MSAFVIASVNEIRDAEHFAEYSRRNTEVVRAHGGHFLVRGGRIAPIEGAWNPSRVVVMQFADMIAAMKWYESDAYRTLTTMRQAISDASIIAVEGVAGG